MKQKKQQKFIHQILLKKAVLASLKSDIDKLHFNNLKTVPTDLSTLSNVVDNNVAKKKKMLIKWYLTTVNLLWPKTSID